MGAATGFGIAVPAPSGTIAAIVPDGGSDWKATPIPKRPVGSNVGLGGGNFLDGLWKTQRRHRYYTADTVP